MCLYTYVDMKIITNIFINQISLKRISKYLQKPSRGIHVN